MFGGDWTDRIIGLENASVEVVMARTPDGSDTFELVRFHSPSAGAQELEPAANRLCYVRGPEGLIVELAERIDGAAG
jgi:hypothetical protein